VKYGIIVIKGNRFCTLTAYHYMYVLYVMSRDLAYLWGKKLKYW
jgi:hypothetical protein